MKKLALDTNFNHKLGCEYMIHIALAPPEDLWEKDMGEPYLFSTKDNSHEQEVYILEDVARATLQEMPDCYTRQSHGMSSNEFIVWFIGKFPQSELDRKMGIYFFKLSAMPVAEMEGIG